MTRFAFNVLAILMSSVMVPSTRAAFVALQSSPSSWKTIQSASSSSSKLDVTRQQFLQTTGSVMAAVTFLGPQLVAAAVDDTTVDAATSPASTATIGDILTSASLRNLKRSQKQLERVELSVADEDFEALKLAIREEPFAQIRKTTFSIIKELADRPEKQELMTASYKNFIASLEKLDSTANLGIRGRKLKEGEFLQLYDDCKKALSAMIDMAVSLSSEA